MEKAKECMISNIVVMSINISELPLYTSLSFNSPFHRGRYQSKKSSDKKIAEIQISVDECGDRWSAETTAIG